MRRGAFVELPPDFLASIARDIDRVPKAYFQGNTISRKGFWLRLRWIYRLARAHAQPFGSVLDFGAGGGVFLPSLANLFDRVTGIDLETQEAEQVVAHFGLDNVQLVRADIAKAELAAAPFDAIVAADTLEHFLDLGPPVAALRRWLKDEGTLFTSLPTENWTYALLRRLYRMEKPRDHYHTGYEVEAFLQARGFQRLRRWFVPLWLPIAPLYIVSAWCVDPAAPSAA
ncbi:MAG: class I SAM-dependent methyltransferase [Planctomycetota bacterium]|jgi:predicted TPR repeat methyltransferase